MNFLLRTSQPAAPEVPVVQELPPKLPNMAKPMTTLEGLIAEDPFPESPVSEDGDGDDDENEVGSGEIEYPSAKNSVAIGDHQDVTEDEGWITIPFKELLENWSDAQDIHSFQSLDRSFIFPGEQLHILLCLAAPRRDTEIITPFKVAAMMNRQGFLKQSIKVENQVTGTESNSITARGNLGDMRQEGLAAKNLEQNGEILPATMKKVVTEADISATESLLFAEKHKQETETLLEKLRNSHFFVRICNSDEPLWFKRNVAEPSAINSQMVGDNSSANDAGPRPGVRTDTFLNAVIEKGNFDPNASGGVARNIVKCCTLSNGDIVVLLQVNIGTTKAKDPVLEVLQFEKYETSNLVSENGEKSNEANHENPCGQLLKWLLPLDHPLPAPVRPLSPPSLSSSSVGTSATKAYPAASGSQLFSFGHFRSSSMSSFPQNATPSTPAIPPPPSRGYDLEDWDRFSAQKFSMNQEVVNGGIISFRAVSLEPERFSVRCGLEGIYIPAKRWRRKLEIVQPLEILSFAADCNTEDLLCVQIKNVCPAHIPDIVILLDAINIIFEEAPKGGPPISLPVACIEAGNDHELPNLALRRGEQHSFILKPANSMPKDPKGYGDKSSQSMHSKIGNKPSNIHLRSNEGKTIPSDTDQYAVLVTCRCNYTESKLFFKHRTTWHPRVRRDLMISVASEMSPQTLGLNGGISQLPVQALTLRASNLTSEDLTLTVLAPASFTSPPSVVSLNSAPSTPMSPFIGFLDTSGRTGGEIGSNSLQKFNTMPHVPEKQEENGASHARSVSLRQQAASTTDFNSTTALGCTHLWLQSTVPLGCVPSQSTATVQLELLPLTDGIITLDTLQIAVNEKGQTYIPEQSLKIHSTSSIASGIY